MKSETSKPSDFATEPRTRTAVGVALVATILLVVADIGSKEWAEASLSAAPPAGAVSPICTPGGGMQRWRTEPYVIISDHLELRYAENCGAAFGMLRDAPPIFRKLLFGTAAIAASITLFVMFVRGRGGPFFAWSVPLIVSGAVGNLIDRVRYGYVVDFIRAYNLNLPFLDEWPTFNVADIGITVGVALLVLDGFRQPASQTAGDTEAANAS